MKKIWRDVLILTSVAVTVSGIVILLIVLAPKPPIGQMNSAREALYLSLRNNADSYSGKFYTDARNYYDSAMENWQNQNKRFLYARDYDKVLKYAKMSENAARLATLSAISNSKSLKLKISQKLDTLKLLVTEIDKLFTTYPLPSETRDRISRGKMLLEEAEIIYKKGQYLSSNVKITDSEFLLKSSYKDASTDLKNYFKLFPLWKRLAEKTINDSRKNGDYSILIDKFSRKLQVYYKGVKKWEFETELGKNWVGDKRIKGDYATPEGMYKIVKKFDNTAYYKALLINYPDEEDIARFKSEIAHGTLPRNAKIGGAIEIHGNGGKGVDWTEGCAALTDSNMDIVYRIARVGTPVTIVGSTIDLPVLLTQK